MRRIPILKLGQHCWCAMPGEEDAIREEMKKVGIEEEALHQVMV